MTLVFALGIPLLACAGDTTPTKNPTILARIGDQPTGPIPLTELINDAAQDLHQLGNWRLLLSDFMIREFGDDPSPEEQRLIDNGQALADRIFEAGEIAFPIIAFGSTPDEQRQTYRALQTSLEQLRKETNAWVVEYLALRGSSADGVPMKAFKRKIPDLTR